jgi:hypothetical protein
MNTCVWWKRRYVVELAENAVEGRGRTGCSSGNCFNVFQWTKEDGDTSSYDGGAI